MAFLLSLKRPWSIGTLHFYPQLLAIEDENSPSSVCLGLSVMPVGRETPYIPQTNKLGFAAVQGYLFLVRLITLVLVSILHQIQVMYFSAASYSFSQLYLYMLFSPYMYFAINTLKKNIQGETLGVGENVEVYYRQMILQSSFVTWSLTIFPLFPT